MGHPRFRARRALRARKGFSSPNGPGDPYRGEKLQPHTHIGRQFSQLRGKLIHTYFFSECTPPKDAVPGHTSSRPAHSTTTLATTRRHFRQIASIAAVRSMRHPVSILCARLQGAGGDTFVQQPRTYKFGGVVLWHIVSVIRWAMVVSSGEYEVNSDYQFCFCLYTLGPAC